ncbi:hypothetical protein [Paenibacillus sp. PL2-23]|uniref:hypothetical protein n=1 Tax=Paenibacillus sp. PL2-23 TaxID=2100729 RepID=UPI00349EC1CD
MPRHRPYNEHGREWMHGGGCAPPLPCRCGSHHGNARGCGCQGHWVGAHCSAPFLLSSCSLCANDFRLNFNGLNGNLSFQLFRMKGCKVKIVYECAGVKEEVEGILCNTGTNYVDVKKSNQMVETVLLDRICNLLWEDRSCNPCKCCRGCEDRHPCPHCSGRSELEVIEAGRTDTGFGEAGS